MPVTIKRINLHEAINSHCTRFHVPGQPVDGARNLVDGEYPELQLVMLVGKRTNRVYGSALCVFEYGDSQGADRVISQVCLLTRAGVMRILDGIKEADLESSLKAYLPGWEKEDLPE